MRLIVIFIILLCSFSAHCFLIRAARKSSLSASRLMGGGVYRTLEEQGKSKKQLWRDLRDSWNRAAATPGFYDDEIPKYDITLYRQCNTDGKQKGDCFKTQFLDLLMRKKKLVYGTKLVNPIDLPAFIRDDHDSDLPVLQHEGKTMTGVLKIMEYLETTFPNSTLMEPGVFTFQDVLNKTENFYPALKNYICNSDFDLEPQLELEFSRELEKIDEMCRSTPGQYVCGMDLTMADLYLLPLLYTTHVAMEHFKDLSFLTFRNNMRRPALEKYVHRMFLDPDFTSHEVTVPTNIIVWGWKMLRGEVKEPYMITRKVKV